MQHGGRGLGQLAGVEQAEGDAAVGVDHRVEVDLADPLQVPDGEQVLAKQLARLARFDVALGEGGVGPLDQRRLLGGELDRLGGGPLLQLEEPVVLGGQPVLGEDVLDRRAADRDAFELEVVTEAALQVLS